MSTKNSRMKRSLLLVAFSLLAVSLACYSNQVPGLFELTPVHTPTAPPVAQNAHFGILEVVLAPIEAGRAFFNLTLDPEPLDDSLLNSKAMCQGNSPAQVLYATTDEESGIVYYLVDCTGSVGWASEQRLAGPLLFASEDLAITQAAPGATSVEMLDDFFKPMPFNPLQTCKPETVVTIREVEAVDVEGDGLKEVLYNIACPTSAGDLTGWVTNNDLVGPVEIDLGQQALALPTDDGGGTDAFLLASEPAPITEENAVEGECVPGDTLTADAVKLVDGAVFYQVTCEDIQGWTAQERFVGPLMYDIDDNLVIFMPPEFRFAEELAAELGDEVDEVEADEPAEEVEEQASDQREVVEYTPPLYLTENPAVPVSEGEDANVAGQCASSTVARILEYEGLEDTVYYRVACEACVETETDADGLVSCTAYEMQEGWAPQQYLLGPLDFVPGQRVTFKSSSNAIDPDTENPTYVRLAASTTGASILGRFTEFAGRCPLEDGVEIVDIVLERAHTSSDVIFFYQVQCVGQVATYGQADDSGGARPVEYGEDGETIIGYAVARDLELLDE